MATIESVTSYEVSIASYKQFNEWRANIILRQNTKPIADVRFVDDPAPFLKYQQKTANGLWTIYVRYSDFSAFMDILRNEKPINAIFYESPSLDAAKMLLSTLAEPVGEGEHP